MTKIGLEIHCQLTNLESKLFCSCKANYREFEPNENICPVCAGMPGSLPRLNQEAVKKATMIAMALNCSTPEKIAFFRKNYFYPDLPKNFQITQLNIYGDTSVGGSGTIAVGDKKIGISIFFPKTAVDKSGLPTLARMLGTKSQSLKDSVFLRKVLSSSAPPSIAASMIESSS